jgi:hypothetical protein
MGQVVRHKNIQFGTSFCGRRLSRLFRQKLCRDRRKLWKALSFQNGARLVSPAIKLLDTPFGVLRKELKPLLA